MNFCLLSGRLKGGCSQRLAALQNSPAEAGVQAKAYATHASVRCYGGGLRFFHDLAGQGTDFLIG
jgi:hypothetical protein